jgi:gliding motility-associated-like protein
LPHKTNEELIKRANMKKYTTYQTSCGHYIKWLQSLATCLLIIIGTAGFGQTHKITSANPGPDQSICLGDSAILGVTATAGVTYSWSPSTGMSSTVGANPKVSPSTTTTYTLTETITATGVTSTGTVTITVNPRPAANTGPNKTLCKGNSVTIGAPPVAGDTYSWTPATGLSSTTSSQPNASPSSTTTYTLTETTTATGCSQSNTVTVTVNPVPADNSGGNQIICNGSSVNIGAPPAAGSSYSWSPATGLSSSTVSNPVANPTTTTTYTLTETFTSSGCFSVNTLQVVVNPLPAANTGPNQSTCDNVSVVIGAPAVAGSTYSWNPSTFLSSPTAAQPIASPTATTTYTLTETITATDCKQSNTVTITVNPSPAANAGPDQMICTVSGTGTGVSIGTPAVVGDTYSWSPATGLSSTTAAQPIANPATTTTYTLTETNTGTGCKKSNIVTVNVYPAPIANAGSNQSLCAGGSVVIGVATINGHSYSWTPSTGLSSSTISNPTASPSATTTYTLTETLTATGCSSTATVTLTVNPLPVANAGPNQTICKGSGVIIGTAAVAGDTYSWSPSTGLSSTTVAQPTASPVSTTTYTLTQTTSSSGCSNTATVTVTVNPEPAANVGPNQTICAGSSVVIGNPAVVGDTYSWSPAAGLSSTTIAQPTASPAATTTYTLTETTSASGCTASNSVTVTVSPLPVANAGSNQTICQGSATTIGAAAVSGNTYSWSPSTGLNSDTLANPTAQPATTTTYTLTETIKGAGCSKTGSVTVTVLPAPAANAGSNQTICAGGSVTIGSTAVAGNTYSWSPGTGLSSTNTSQTLASPATTTTYTLTETNTANGCSKANTVTVLVNPTPTANTGPNQTICKGSSVVIGGAAVFGNTYSWSPSTGLSSATVSNPTASPAATTTYTLTESAGASCATSNTVVITVNPLPIANAGPAAAVCKGESVSIGTAGISGDSYSWSPSAGLANASAAQTNATPSASITYTLSVTGSNGCKATDTVHIQVNPLPNAFTGPAQTMCAGSTVSIGGAAVAGDTYSWTPSGGLNSTTSSQPSAAPASTTTYTLTETITSTGCSKSDSVVVTVTPLPNATTGNGVKICKGGSVAIGAAAVNGDTYSWSPSSGLNSATTSNPNASPSVTTTYTLTESTSGGCSKSNTVTVSVDTTGLPMAYTGPAQTINAGSTVTIGGPAVAGNSYTWTPGSGLNSSTISQPAASPAATTTYTLTETNSAGCKASGTVLITVLEVEFYNGFSPNGDGKNDGWNIPMLNAYPNNSVLIINRWGSEVWLGTNYDSKSVIWTGQNMSGQDLPDGTYYYIISYNNQEKRGWVVVKR